MNVFTLAAAVLYVLAFLAAWPLGLAQNLAHAIAFAAAGLLCALVGGAGAVVRQIVSRTPPSGGGT